MNPINNSTSQWLDKNNYKLDSREFTQFQNRVGDILTKTIQSGHGLTVDEARAQAIKEFRCSKYF